MPANEARELAALFIAAIEGNYVLARTLRNTSPLISAGVHLTRLAHHAIDRVEAGRSARQR